jgi:hypothetical protein
MLLLIDLFLSFGLQRVAGFIGRIYHRVFGYPKFVKNVAPLLGMDTMSNGVLIGKLAPPSNDWKYKLKRNKGTRLSLIARAEDGYGNITEIFEMPLPHVTRELNVPVNGRGARGMSWTYAS